MMILDQYLNILARAGLDITGAESWRWCQYFEELAGIAEKVRINMPSIGLFSETKRYNCFIEISRRIDLLISEHSEKDQFDEEFAIIPLIILGNIDVNFVKASVAFIKKCMQQDMRVLDAMSIYELPKTARLFLISHLMILNSSEAIAARLKANLG
jgi:hypothetical protein